MYLTLFNFKIGLVLDSLLTASLLFNGMYSRDKNLTK